MARHGAEAGAAVVSGPVNRLTILDGWDAVLTQGADAAARVHEEIQR